MDESGFEAETIRSHGYAPIGKPCIDSYNWQASRRTNVIGALYEKMLFALEYVVSYGEETVQVNLVNQLRYLSAYDD
ncbi:hypothetical protein ACS8FD_14565 [Psychrobacter sp. 1U2]